MTDEEHFDLTLANAERLLLDSLLLNSNERARSAIILAVFAIEELGKALITNWGVRNLASKREHPTHVEKQTASFALLSADEMLKKNRKRMLKLITSETFSFLNIGPLSTQFVWARQGFYDDLRMAATYADKEPKLPLELTRQFDCDLATELHELFKKAVLATRRHEAMTLAAKIYMNGLGRL